MSEQEWGMQQKKQDTSANWMLTFADLLSLMLTFFVLLFSMSVVEKDEWLNLRTSLAERLNPNYLDEPDTPGPSAVFSVNRLDQGKPLDLDYLEAVLKDKIHSNEALQQIQLIHHQDQLIISLSTDAFFTTGTSRLRPEMEETLAGLSASLMVLNQRIETYGHAPSAADQGDTNPWALSLGRAVTIGNYLQRYGYMGSIEAYGMGDMQSWHLDAALPEALRIAQARRVDLVISSQAAF